MRLSLLFLFCFIFQVAIAQPNLEVSYITPPPVNVPIGSNLIFTYRIKNIGTSTSQTSHASVYLSPTTNFVDAIKLNDISTESLTAGTETKDVNFVFPVPYKFNYGSYYVMILPDSRAEVTGNTNNLVFYNQSTLNISSAITQQNLPYPVILVHGWGGNDTTWYPFLRDVLSNFGYSYGGNMDFCLNQDGNTSSSVLANDFKDWTDTTTLLAGDFYTVNFDINRFGLKYDSSSESNQSAAVKQGIAIQKAVQHVLAITHKRKVILVAHSMGGLATREYLQNSSDWQPDGQHHVAKLHTTGTPHGGSNATSFNLTELFNGMDETSEAVRDLRESYDVSGSPGVYLYGGIESLSVMDNSLFENYVNADVNCDGVIGESITGLNQKSLYTNLGYSCTIGVDTYPIKVCSNCDGVVDEPEANLNNYYNINADTFICVGEGSAAHPFHLDLPKQTSFLFQGIDEPQQPYLAYDIDTGKIYFGHYSIQSLGSNTIVDSDYYTFNVPQNSLLNISEVNIPVPNSGINIVDATNKLIFSTKSNGAGNINDSSIALSAGTYYINLYGLPDAVSWEYPYSFNINYSETGICPSTNAIFTTNSLGTFYQWEVDTGKGYSNITASNVYSGVNSPTLLLTSPPTSWYGYKYRCVINGNETGSENILRFSANWSGALNTSWENPLNWNCGILPDENTDVYINNITSNSPQVNNIDYCRILNQCNGTLININKGAKLVVSGH